MKKLTPVFLSVLLSMGITLQSASVAFGAPHEIYGRVIMNSADYYLDTDIDEFGNARIFPSKTTFSAADAVTGATALTDRFTLRTNEGDNAVYTYSPSRLDGYVDWAKKITRVTYLSYDWAEIIRYNPSDLSYEEQNNGLVLKTKGMPSGIYTVRIYSEGSETFVLNLEIQKEAPTLIIASGSSSVTANDETAFRLNGLGFSWNSAVYEVLLNHIKLSPEQYTVVSNNITLAENVLKQTGENTLTVKSYGYKDASMTFTVLPASNIQYAGQVMAVSSATSSGSGSEVDATSSASGTVPAFLVFNFDMLANAEILKQHNMETEASKSVLTWWEDARKEVVRGEGSMNLYDWESYLNSGKTFEDHIASGGQKASAADGLFWDMWEVKHVLENGKLGDPYDFYEQIAAPYPEITSASGDWNNGVVLTFGNTTTEEFSTWVSGITKSETEVSTNSAAIKIDSTGLYQSEYQIDSNKRQLILPKETLVNKASEGSTLTIRSSGYKTIHHKITFASGTYSPELVASTYYVGDKVEIKNIPSDMSDITVKVGTTVLYNGTGSGSKYYFTTEQDGESSKIAINSANFPDAGTYTVKIQSSNYAPQSVKVRMLDTAGKPQYSIGFIPNITFDQLIEGYEEAEAKMVSIANTGNQGLTNLTATMSGGEESNFILDVINSELPVGASSNLTISPKLGLTDGTYTETITLTADAITPVTFTVTQKVVANGQGSTDPNATYALSITEDSPMVLLKSSYAEVSHTTITVKNTGNAQLTGLAAEIDGSNANNFTVELDNTTLNVGDSTNLKVTPQIGLAPGDYKFTVKINGIQLQQPVVLELWQTVHVIDASAISYGKIKLDFGYKTGTEVTAVSLDGKALSKDSSGSPPAGQFYLTGGNYPSVSIKPFADTPDNVSAELTVKVSSQTYTFTVLLNTKTGAISPITFDDTLDDGNSSDNDTDNEPIDNNSNSGSENESEENPSDEQDDVLGENEYRLGTDVVLDAKEFQDMFYPSFTIEVGSNPVSSDSFIFNSTNNKLTINQAVFEAVGTYEIKINATDYYGFTNKSSNLTITIKA